MKDPAVVGGLDELMPHGEFRGQLAQLEGVRPDGLASEKRKAVLVDTFTKNLSRLGNYKYVAETTILRPSKNRPLYCLFYATRHPKGIEVFRDCQLKALTEQSKTRAAIKVRSAEDSTGQSRAIPVSYMIWDRTNSPLSSLQNNWRLKKLWLSLGHFRQ